MKTTKQMMKEIADISDEMGRNIEVDRKGAFICIATDFDEQMTSYIGSSDTMYSMLMTAMLNSKDIADVVLQVAQDFVLTDMTKQSLIKDIN